MKLLHVSDWHLGRVTYNESRAIDHDAVLGEIIALARREKPDLIVHSGDLFDHARPSYQDMSKATTVLQELAAVAPVVVVCGNHDSPLLFNVFAQLLGPDSGIHFVDKARAPSDGGILRFPTSDGFVARVAALPFVNANRYVDAFDDPGSWRGDYAERIGRMERALAAGLMSEFDDRRDIAIFAAHQYVGGAHFAGSERPVHASDYYVTNADDLPSVSYAAFGHIHKPQKLPSAKVTGRYAGSPIQLDFGEEGERKSVVLAELHPGRPADIHIFELTGGRPLSRLEGTLEELVAVAPTVGRALCQVTVHTETQHPALAEQVHALLPDAVVVQINEVCADQRLEVLTPEVVAADVEPDLQQLFRDYLTEQGTGGTSADRVMTTFAHVLTAVEEQRQVVLPEEDLLSAPLETDTVTVAKEAAR
ncbi:exonuclease SbcD [Amycolatopsis pretoriensis]|uniref:Nuclease SbcCD subunit D n=1 Tax=Amycolatopsis pretoriensis TaxID=218821 RepID=A0A1H5RL31_9PSEU|nr:exonuclease SbcCD subunit D [Amycolatopsis pretoriensis]SEF38408.1 exonuclease SbcD [Amycolatopsis pretoriensis]